MSFQYIPYIWPLTASALFSISLAIYAWKRRSVKGAGAFIWCMIFVTTWTAANALEMSGTDLPTKLFWANMQYIAYGYSPFTWLVLVMQFTGYDEWIRNKRVFWLAILPAVTVLLLFTDHYHGLMRHNVYLDYNGAFPVIAKDYGIPLYISGFYFHLLNLCSIILLIRAVFIKNTVYKRQAAALLAGLGLIALPNLFYIWGLSPVERFDITPLFFVPAGLIITWGIFRYRLFDVIPVARATVIEAMEDGVMVLDLQDRVLDINPAMENIIGLKSVEVLANPVQEVCRSIPELSEAYLDRSISHFEFNSSGPEGNTTIYDQRTEEKNLHTSLSSGRKGEGGGEEALSQTPRLYEAYFSPLKDQSGDLIGRFVLIYDITERKIAQQETMRRQWMEAVIEERERMTRDLHDNLGQVLGFINLQAQGIKTELLNAGVEITSDKLSRLVDVTQSAHHEIRQYIHHARKSAELEKDFISALQKEIKQFEDRTDINVTIDFEGDINWEGLRPDIRLHILNIVREALNNTRKHAGADIVKITFAAKSDWIFVIVEDDGRGFDAEKIGHGDNKKYGLNIMRERAVEIGALINIQSSPEEGTRVELRVPLKSTGGDLNERKYSAGG